MEILLHKWSIIAEIKKAGTGFQPPNLFCNKIIQQSPQLQPQERFS